MPDSNRATSMPVFGRTFGARRRHHAVQHAMGRRSVSNHPRPRGLDA